MEQTEVFKYIRIVKQQPENVKKIATQKLIEHSEICFEVIQINSENIKYIPMNVRESLPQICIEAVKQKPENIMYVPEDVQIQYPQMCLDAVKKTKGILYYISVDVLENNPEICLEALLTDSECYEDIPEEIIEEHPEIELMRQVIDDYTYVEQISKEELRKFPQIYLKSLQEKKENEKGSILEDIIDNDLIVNNSYLAERCLEQFDFKYDRASKLIAATQDIDFIKKILREKNVEISIDTLIEEFGEGESLIEDLIANKDEYSFTDNELAEIVLGKNDIEYAIEFFANNIWQDNIETSLIHLPKGMTIGIEIECEGDSSKQILNLEELFKGWEIKEDATLGEWDEDEKKSKGGVEVVSPVLQAEDKNETSIYKVCSFLDWAGQSVTEKCGGHIHIGADYLKDINAWKNLVEIWSNTEKMIFLISNDAGNLPRESVYEFAGPILEKLHQALDDEDIELDSEEDIVQFCKQLKKVQSENPNDVRYSAINFENFGDENKNTIEFRLSNGTLNPRTWIENINLFGGIIAVSQEISDIQRKLALGQELSKNEINKLDNYELLKTQISDREKLSALLELAIPIENEKIYQHRYRVNSSINQAYYFSEGNILRPISIGRKKIARLAFIGNEQVTGEEYVKNVQIIQAELQQENSIEKSEK